MERGYWQTKHLTKRSNKIKRHGDFWTRSGFEASKGVMFNNYCPSFAKCIIALTIETATALPPFRLVLVM